MPNVYILLTRTHTLFARALHNVTGNRYTHSSIALDRQLDQLYSFARRYEHLPLPGGFIRENIFEGVYGRCMGADSMVLEVPVSQESYDYIERRISWMERRKREYDYDLIGVAMAGLGVQYVRPYKYFCSHFVSEMLVRSGAVIPPKHPSLMRPEDFMNMGFEVVYEGPLMYAAYTREPQLQHA